MKLTTYHCSRQLKIKCGPLPKGKMSSTKPINKSSKDSTTGSKEAYKKDFTKSMLNMTTVDTF